MADKPVRKVLPKFVWTVEIFGKDGKPDKDHPMAMKFVATSAQMGKFDEFLGLQRYEGAGHKESKIFHQSLGECTMDVKRGPEVEVLDAPKMSNGWITVFKNVSGIEPFNESLHPEKK